MIEKQTAPTQVMFTQPVPRNKQPTHFVSNQWLVNFFYTTIWSKKIISDNVFDLGVPQCPCG